MKSTHPRARKAAPPKATNWTLILAIVTALAVVAIVVYAIVQASAPLPGKAVANQGRDHVKPGEPHPAYNNSPPTSGWHYAETAKWGIHDEPVVEEFQIHNLEHGGILIQYHCPQGCPEVVDQLKKIANGYPTKVLLAPYPKMQSRIALTAWDRIDTMDNVDEARIKQFISAFINRGPENAP